MQLKKHAFWGVLLYCIPFLLCAQSAEQLIHTIPTNHGRPLGINRTTSILSIQENVSGFYVLTQKDGCYLVPHDSYSDLQQLAIPTGRRDYFLNLMSSQNEVFLWANGYEILSLTSNNRERLPFSTSYFTQTVEAKNIIIDHTGTIYVGTFSDGLFIFTKDEWGGYSNLPKRISTFENQLPSNTIHCLYKDRNNIIWVGTDAGLASISDGQIQNLSEKEVLPQNWWQKLLGIQYEKIVFSEPVYAITNWGNSLLLAGKDDLYKASVVENSLQYLHEYNLSDRMTTPLNDMKDLLVDINGNLWIAANHLLFFDITKDQLSVMSDTNIFRGKGFLCLAEDVREGKIWIGTNRGGLYKLNYPDPNMGIGF